jgi:hypothetical protein
MRSQPPNWRRAALLAPAQSLPPPLASPADTRSDSESTSPSLDLDLGPRAFAQLNNQELIECTLVVGLHVGEVDQPPVVARDAAIAARIFNDTLSRSIRWKVRFVCVSAISLHTTKKPMDAVDIKTN